MNKNVMHVNIQIHFDYGHIISDSSIVIIKLGSEFFV